MPTLPPRGGINFNPLTPCGVRLTESILAAVEYQFQSTHPMRGETAFMPRAVLDDVAQRPTHPMRGET